MSRVRADDCGVAAIKPQSEDPAEIMAEARVYAAHDHFAQARAMYQFVLDRHPNDADFQVSLARVDGWAGCYRQAEARLREVLALNPRNNEARGVLVDQLLWQQRVDEAEQLVKDGLEQDPDSGEMWMKRAALMQREGDATLALAAADRAVELMPDDPAARDMRDHMYLEQIRTFVRVDFYPHAFPSIYTNGWQYLHRIHRLELTFDATFTGRYGGVNHLALFDRVYALGFTYRVRDFGLGLGLAFGLPAIAVPEFAPKVSLGFPIIPRWSGLAGYSFWQYQNGKRIHILNALLSFDATETININLLWWMSVILAPRPASFYAQVRKTVHVASVRVNYRPSPHFMIGAGYTFGPQLDQTYDPERLASLESQIFSLYADWLITHRFGLQPAIDVEWRKPEHLTPLYIFSAQLAAYLRFR